ncbi:MAG: DUF4831 family protein [Bacteroidales bacterium]
MKNIVRLFLSFLIPVTVSSCLTGKKASESVRITSLASDTVGLRDGSLIYALPRTVFTLKVEAERTVMIPGPYADYAEDLLGLKNVPKTREEHWSLKNMSVCSHDEVDPSEYYVIHTTGMFRSNVLALKKEGVILDINPATNYEGINNTRNGETNSGSFNSFDLGSDEYYEVQTDTAFRRVKVDSAFIRIPYIIEKKKKLTQDQLAERTAKRIMELRDGKVLILTGEANVFPQNDASINEINRLEKDYTELFTGKSFTDTRIYTYQFIPVKESAGKSFAIFSFSDETGPGDAGVPVLVDVVPEQKTKDIVIIENEKQESQDFRYDKLFYRIPDVANIKISMNGITLYSSRKLVYQLGEVMQLPSNYLIGK